MHGTYTPLQGVPKYKLVQIIITTYILALHSMPYESVRIKKWVSS
jgi:hypothetical protein